MKRTASTLLILSFLLATSHRLPAPIEEVPESPTPTPTATPLPTLQPSALPSVTPERVDPARFAGNWTGKINIAKMSDVEVALIINPEATSVDQKSKRGAAVNPAIYSGHTLSWRAGPMHDIIWTLTPNPDGQTALVTSKVGAGVENTAIFQRVSPSPSPSPGPARKRRPGMKGSPLPIIE